MKCRICGHETKETDNFCIICGTKLKDECRCWLKKGDSYDCGESNCPGYGLFSVEKSKIQ